MDYPVETFTDAEREALAPHFTNLDRPVFGLVNLPETVKGAMFARYSRYQGTLRRMYLDEFAGGRPQAAEAFDGAEGERARQLYERIFLGYGDDSVAQLGGAHIACEWVSNVMTKLLQRGRLAAYLEQSTRYIPYDAPIAEGLGYRYWRHAELGPEYERTMDFLFDAYAEALPRVEAWAADRFPRPDGEPEAAHRRAIRAKALDLLRGLLPAASLSHMGIFGTGQAYEQLLLRLYASPLPEARDYADMILAELKAIMPSFVARVERPERGGEWIAYLQERGAAAERWTRRLGLDRARRDEEAGPAVRLLSVEGGEDELLAALLFEAASCSEDEARSAVRALPPDERATMLARAGGRAPQPPPPAGARLRGAPLPLRGGVGLRRVPRPAASPHAHDPVAGARPRARGRRAGGARARRGGRLLPRGARALERRVRAHRRRGAARAGALRALPRLPDPLRARHERARGHAPDRAALRARGPPGLPRRGARAARRDRRGAPRRGGGDGLRGPRHGAAPGADPLGDPGARQAGRAGVAMDLRVAPSILAADFSRLGEQVEQVMDAGARVIHVDVMDGHFVPPISIGAMVAASIQDLVHGRDGILDVHLMVERPEQRVEEFAAAGADTLIVHWEATPHVHYALKAVRDAGMKAGLAINPATAPESVMSLAGAFDQLLCMTVNPGWGGQPYIEASTAKVARLRELLGPELPIEVDGGIDAATARETAAAGATLFVAGSSIFGSGDPAAAYREIAAAAGAA